MSEGVVREDAPRDGGARGGSVRDGGGRDDVAGATGEAAPAIREAAGAGAPVTVDARGGAGLVPDGSAPGDAGAASGATGPGSDESPRPDGVGAPSAISVRDLSLTFGTGEEAVHALSHVDLEVRRGDFVSFIGPSGCGKTTLLRVIADLERATGGTIEVNGTTPEAAHLARAYGYVFQSASLFPWRRIAENVALPLEVMGLDRAARRERVARNLELVELAGFERKYPHQLSGGMQQRASIARALAVEPELLLMDEPFGALDEIVRDHLNEQLLALWRRTGKTIVFVTHSIPEAVYLSTRIVVMSPRPGRIHEVIDSDLPAERPLGIRETPGFLALAQRVREGLRAGHGYDDV